MAPIPIESTDLVVFAAAARRGSFAAAAAELQLSAPSVSTRLAALESRLGTKLFQRGARGSVLTPEGERLAGYARRCLDLLDEAVADLGAQRSQRLVLAAPASLAPSVFPPALAALADRPVAAHCRVAHSDEVVQYLLDGTAHAGFVLAGTPADAVRTVRVTTSPIVAVCGPDHPLAHRRRLRIADLTDSPVVVYRWGPGADALAARFDHPRRAGERPVHTIGMPMTAVQLAVDAGYVAVVPAFAAARAPEADRIRRLPIPLGSWKLEVRFCYPPSATQRPGVTALLDHMPHIRAALAGHDG